MMFGSDAGGCNNPSIGPDYNQMSMPKDCDVRSESSKDMDKESMGNISESGQPETIYVYQEEETKTRSRVFSAERNPRQTEPHKPSAPRSSYNLSNLPLT